MSNVNQTDLTNFLRECMEVGGVGSADNMKIETLGDGAVIATTSNKTRFLVTVQQLPSEVAQEAEQSQAATN